jgi:putative tryptophan/tyrosine transport system substrate-binding protein
VAFIFNPPRAPYGPRIGSFVEQAAQHHSVEYLSAPVFEPDQVEQVIQKLSNGPAGAFIACPDALMATHRKDFITIANKYRLPGLWMPREYALEGALIAYGPSLIEHFRQAAEYVDRILRGRDKPADLPVQEPIKFQLVINMKTAKAMGLTVSSSMQLLADEIIE